MKSGGPWNLRGLRPETREAARAAARRSRMSVGEWLNSVIKLADAEDEDPAPAARFERDSEDSWRQSFDSDDRQQGRRRDDADRRGRDRRWDDRWRPSFPSEEPQQDRRPRDAFRSVRRSDDQWRQNADEQQQDRRQADANRRNHDQRRHDQRHPVFRGGERDHAARQHDDDWREPSGELEGQLHLNWRNGDQQRHRHNGDQGRPRGDRMVEEAEAPPLAENGERADEGANRPRPQPGRFDEPVRHRPPQARRNVSLDQAVAEITARQRVLDSETTAAAPAPRRMPDREPAGFAAKQKWPREDFTGEAPADRFDEAETVSDPAFTRPQPSPIMTQPDVFGELAAETAFSSQPLPSRFRGESTPAWNAGPQSENATEAAFDLGDLQRQLRQITARIEALRPASDLEAAINGLRSELAEIGRTLAEAMPRRAVESLELEIRALAQRIDQGRRSGVDGTALAGLEQGLAEMREVLRGLTTAEGLVGFDETVRTLARKIELVSAKDDPAALQQLETAIGALRGIVSHVASNDTLTKVAEDVRALSVKIDELANSAASGHALSALENRIDLLATALNTSTAAGYEVPRELEKLLAGLVEKLESVRLSHTDHTALAHLEDRIAMLVKRLDASDARLGLLEGVERGLADLLVYIEQLRNAGGGVAAAAKPVAVEAIEHEVAEIKQTGRRIQDSLEAVHGTVEHVVGRLAMIESDIRSEKVDAAAAEALPASEPMLVPAPPETAAMSATSAIVPAAPAESALHWSAASPQPPGSELPPDHPLEPGSAAGFTRPPLSAAERIAASEAVAGSTPPLIADPGAGKPDFIAAARRAARAAAAAPNDRAKRAGAGARTQQKTLSERLRNLVVAGAVVVIVLGCFHMASRLFQDGGSAAPPHPQAEPQTESPGAGSVPPPQAEEPSAPATPAPRANPTSLPTLPLPLPSADAARNPAPQPPANPPPTTGRGAGGQSLLNEPETPSAMAASLPAVADTAAANGSGPAPATDITGTVPVAPVQRSATTAPLAAITDKLPLAIGGPALREAALAGDPAAAYEVAVRFADGRLIAANNEEAAHWFERAAKRGLAPAQFRLGTLYEKGLGVRKDLVAARDLYRAAADKGHGKAMHNLAVLYAEGVDGAADYRTAAQWFRKAADHGIVDSQYNLAILYARGVGVEQNFAEAYKWFDLAAKDGDQDAAKKRDQVGSHLDQQSLAAARLAAQKWTAQPQPADAVTVKAPAAWDLPANGSSARKPKARTAKAVAAEPAKVD